MNLNKVYLIGRLTQDPETRATQSGQNVTNLRIATNRVWNDQSGRKESTEYHTIVAWGRLGDIASHYLKKGSLVMIEGRLQTRSWTGKDNIKRYNTEVVAEGLQLGPKSAGPSASSQDYGSRQTSSDSSDKEPEIPIINEDEPLSAGVEEDEMSIKEKDLPF